MKRLSLIVLVIVMALMSLYGTSTSAAPFQQAATPTAEDIQIGPANATPTTGPTTKPLVAPSDGGGSVGGTAVATMPANTIPPTLDDLLKQYPDLKPYLDKIKDRSGKDLDFSELYSKILQIYKDKGATGVGSFLKSTGILDKLGLPLSYLDLLNTYDQGGMDAVTKLAKQRKIINAHDEIGGYLAIDDPANVDSVKADLTKLGVTPYDYLPDTGELEIGIPTQLMGQYQTPGALIQFMVSIAQVNHVVGFRAPTPQLNNGHFQAGASISVGAKTVGADKWIAKGITGKGVKVGILDGGFGGIKGALGQSLPANVESNTDLDELDAQEENHGTACAAIVHGIAPDAQLYIAWFDATTGSGLSDALDYLAQSKVSIVSFSMGQNLGPRDGTFGDALVMDEFVQQTSAMVAVSAGNDGAGHTRFPFKGDSDGNAVFGKDKAGNAVTLIPFAAGVDETEITMDWNGSWNGKEKTEYDLTVLDKDGNAVAQAAEPRKGRKNDYPFQMTAFQTNPGDIYFLQVNSPKPGDNTIDIFVHEGQLADWALVPAYSISTPADSDNVLSVGATGLTKDEIEYYSSQGPTTDERLKPDVAAPTGEKLPLPGFEDGFYGTSGSAPLAAGAAALVQQANPKSTGAQLKAFLVSHAKGLGDPIPNPIFGAGRLALGDPGKGPTNPKPTPKGGKPTPVPANPSGASATISSTDVKFNTTFKGQKGVKATLSFEIDNFSGQQAAVGLIFLDQDGKTALPPSDPKATVGKTIGVVVPVTPDSDQAVYDNAVLFIPNSAFTKIKSKKTITYLVAVLDFSDENNPQILASTDAIPLNIK